MNTNHPASASSLDDTDAGLVWTRGLKKYGNYYEGIVERAELVLEMHKQDIITTFGIRWTKKPRSAPVFGKEYMMYSIRIPWINPRYNTASYRYNCGNIYNTLLNSQRPKYTGSKQLVT